jgi:hypothetical protein
MSDEPERDEPTVEEESSPEPELVDTGTHWVRRMARSGSHWVELNRGHFEDAE